MKAQPPVRDLHPFEKVIGYSFKNADLLTMLFVHRSYINEHKSFPLDHNERLEFLGDAVLELVVTEYLFQKYENPEGELTNWRSALVKGVTLSECAREIGMEEYLLLSRGEAQSTGKARQLILANAFEALIGAIYLDGGHRPAQRLIKKFLLVKLQDILNEELYVDPKSRLQELVQEKKGVTPIYRVLSEEGPDHNKQFKIGVFVGGDLFGSGEGFSKQKSQQEAAKDALKRMKNKS